MLGSVCARDGAEAILMATVGPASLRASNSPPALLLSVVHAQMLAAVRWIRLTHGAIPPQISEQTITHSCA